MVRPSKKTMPWLMAHVIALVVIFVTLGTMFAFYQGSIKAAIVAFFLPDAWAGGGEMLLDLFVRQNPLLVTLVTMNAIMAVLPLLMFYLREKFSASYEEDLNGRGRTMWIKPDDKPIFKDVADEGLFAVMGVSLSLGVLHLALIPGCALFATILGYAVNFLTLTETFVGPTLSRNGVRATDVYRILFVKHFKDSILAGAIFTAPTILLGLLLPLVSAMTGFILLAVTNIVLMTVFLMVGTNAGTKMAQAHRWSGMKPSPYRYGVWAAVLGLLVFNAVFFTKLGGDLLHVSPLLKCEWTYVDDSLDVEMGGRAKLKVNVHNPTRRLAKIGDNQILITHDGDLLGQTQIPPFEVLPGATAQQEIEIAFKLESGLLAKGGRLLGSLKEKGIVATATGAAKSAIDRDKYDVTLVLPTPVDDLRIKLL